jgi:hypothetical protein
MQTACGTGTGFGNTRTIASMASSADRVPVIMIATG